MKPRTLVGKSYRPEIFGVITDILAELVLEDLRQFPTLMAFPVVDNAKGKENTPNSRQLGHTKTTTKKGLEVECN